jgi:Ca2+-binding RTX toxin-like protein
MGGADIICGGPGSERGVNDAGLDGGDGPDIIHGGGYRDELNGGKGRDILFGGKDRDWICDGICNWDPDEDENVVFADTERADMLIGLGGPDTCVVSGPKDVALAC